jgi:hypothetical protein
MQGCSLETRIAHSQQSSAGNTPLLRAQARALQDKKKKQIPMLDVEYYGVAARISINYCVHPRVHHTPCFKV